MRTIVNLVLLFTISGLILAQTPDTSLIAYYPFNGNAIDLTGNGHNGIVNGGILTTDRFNQSDKAYTFPNLHNNIVLESTTGLNLENGFTINAWVKYKNINCGIVGKHNCWYVNGFNLGIDNGQFWLVLANSVWSIVKTNETYVEDKWYMVTGVYDQVTSTGKVFINGVLKASGSVLYNNYSTAPITISEASNGCPDGNMPGAIDEVKIYNRPLSDTEILDEYNRTYTDLVLFLPFNGNANDESGNNNNGTVNGAQLTQDRFGINNRAYQFNGLNDFISIADNPNLFSDELTISWWYKLTETPGAAWVVTGWVDGGHRYQQFFSGGQIAYLNGYNLSQPGVYFNPLYGLNDLDVWKNVVVTYKKLTETTSTTSIYVDGELKQTDNHTLAMDYASGPDFFIGKNHNGNFFKGSLDDFRIYNRILNNDEILALYNDSTTYTPVLIDSVYPHQNSNYLTKNESIKIFFSEPMNEATFTYYNLYVHGSLTGKYDRNFTYQSSSNTLEIQPTIPFKNGEQITVTLDSSIQSVSGYNLSPFVFQFNVKPEKGTVKFAVADSFQLNFSPQNIVSGDFNNDLKIDISVSNYDSSKYTILLNNGSGGFTLGEELSGPFKPHSISFTDIDNDTDLDMIVSTNEQNQIHILRGTGQGTFTEILPTINANAPIATCTGDFDGDGDNDFVALCNTGKAFLFKNDGTGIFTQSGSTSISVPASIRNIVGDFDNDGDLDIVAGTSDYWGSYKLLLNDCSGNFTFVNGDYYGPYPDELGGGDFNGDYNIDFVKCDWYQNGIQIAVNNGNANFSLLNLGNAGGQTRNPIVNDFDGDGDLDFVCVFNGNYLGIAKNNTHPNYELYLSEPIPGLKSITTGDFDNNGSVDLVGISSTTNQVKFIRNISDSLIAYFPFNGNANDESVFNNNGNAINTLLTTDRYANSDAAYYFNGSDSRIYVPENSLYDFGFGDFTITSWVNASEIKTARIVSAGYDANDNIWGFGFGTHPVWGSGNRINYFVYSGNAYHDFSSDEILNYTPGEWIFVTTAKSGNQIKFYTNGLPVGTSTIFYPSNSNSYMSIGCRQWLSNNLTEFFNGKIDEVKIFNKSFSDQEIWQMYKTTTTAPNLLLPLNNSTINTLTPLLDWDSLVTATNYTVYIATDSLFNNIILSQFSNQSSYLVESGALSANVDYFWKVRTNNDGGIGPWSEIYKFKIILTDVDDEKQLPKEFALLQNYPNPFNPSTTITYHLPKASKVELKVYDIIGNEIATLVNQEKPAGKYTIEFDGSDISSGVYLYRLKTDEFIAVRKIILIK